MMGALVRSLATLLLPVACAAPVRQSAGKDAVAFWHFDDDQNGALALHGNARLGIELGPEEREASLLRGGDGRAARLDGGWLSAGGAGKVTGKALSIAVRLRAPSGRWNAPLFSRYGGHARLTYNLYSSATHIGFELGTDYRKEPLRLSAPLDSIGRTEWHDVVVRYRGHIVELFVNGVLVDEEWPAGSLRTENAEPLLIGGESEEGRVKAGFAGLVDHAGVWDRALSDDEVASLSGGKRPAPAPPSSTLQYWKPPGHNTFVGDCMPFFQDGTFRLYYLFDRRQHRSKFGIGAHQWAHASSKDLVRWIHHPLALPLTDEREGSICTGSVFFHGGTYYAFYATRMADGSGERLGYAVSPDAVRFEKKDASAIIGPWPAYDRKNFRDPVVFRAGDRFHMLVSSRTAETGLGCLAHLTSPDLLAWRAEEPFVVASNKEVPECADHFTWNGWSYLLTTRYRMSRDPLGPWQAPEVDALDNLYVPKTAAFTGNRRLYVSWLREGGFGGCIVFRELVQHPDGTLGTKFPPEMIPPRGEPIDLPKAVRIVEEKPLALPRDFYLRTMVRPAPGVTAFGLRLRGGSVTVRPAQRRVEVPGGAIQKVDGLDRPFGLEVIRKGDILDICVDGRRTYVTRLKDPGGEEAVLFAGEGEVTFDDLEVRPLR